MKINIAQLRQAIGARQSFTFHSPVEEIVGGKDGFWLHGAVDVRGEVVNNGRFFAVTGTAGAASALTCTRCLDDFSRQVSIPFTETFREQGAADDPDATVFHGDEIDIAEIVREAMIIAEPLKALCSDDCQGLCPICGVNRNQISCDCKTVGIDPRLAALEKLLPQK
jgi:Predicted metal-binding, possibly nucleic acid-binding protein